jgi:hypothetical protein
MTLLKHYSKLSKAVSDDAAPIPGYLYLEIAKITYESRGNCTELEDWLLKKLGKNSPCVVRLVCPAC